MTPRRVDVAIIGAGTAGLAAERSARRAGARTLLIDAEFSGTTCARVGCMPSKLLLAAARAAHSLRQAKVFGIDHAEGTIDSGAVLARVRRERDAFVASVLASIDKIPANDRIETTACFVSPSVLALGNQDQVACQAVVIATGSRPHVPKAFSAFADRLLTNETLFELRALPRSVAVVGAGSLGLEIAQALSRLGVRIRVFDAKSALPGVRDSTVAQRLRSMLQRELPLTLGVQLNATPHAQGVTVSWRGEQTGVEDFERILVAAGRPPSLEALRLETTGIELDRRGVPVFDRQTMQCGRSAIFMAGDADADRAVLHEASVEGAIAGANAATFPIVAPGKRTTPLQITFTDPPAATVGAPRSDDSVIGDAPYEDQGRAKVDAVNEGLVRLFAERATGRITGAELCAPAADHLAHLIAWAIERGETARSMLGLPFYHPTFEEGLKPALRAICAQVDTVSNAFSDEGQPPGA